ncbi:MAG: class I SAM-dependent methyltransferase [Alphaproteobacteria bacterium]|nr:class I SAM-dependent methyltransferase [Alphaproteobacteria bacterium]
MTDWRASVDFGRTAADYARHRAGYPDELFERLVVLGVGQPGQRLLDLATGTGFLGRGFARRGARVTGLDRSDELLGEARRLDAEAGVETDCVLGRAEETGLPDTSFDVVTVGQAWHWFERPKAAAEARRLLVPGGAMAMAHFDWLPVPGSVVEASEALIQAHNPDWPWGGRDGFHTYEAADLSAAGFGAIESFSFDVHVPYSAEAWRGRIRASAGVGATLSADRIAAFDAAHVELLAERFGDELMAPHRAFAMIGRAP